MVDQVSAGNGVNRPATKAKPQAGNCTLVEWVGCGRESDKMGGRRQLVSFRRGANMPLMVKCPHCKREHPSAIQMDPQSFKSSVLEQNVESCPFCGRSAPYSKSLGDYFFK